MKKLQLSFGPFRKLFMIYGMMSDDVEKMDILLINIRIDLKSVFRKKALIDEQIISMKRRNACSIFIFD